MLPLLRAQRIGGSHIATGDFESGIEIVRPHGKVARGPAEKFSIEALRSGLVRGGQLNPAKIARQVLFDDGHPAILRFLRSHAMVALPSFTANL